MRKKHRHAWAIPLLTCLLLLSLTDGCRRDDSSVVVIYTSQDEVFAESILQQFEQESGIRVRKVYDSEAVKTVGLVNRLLAERDNPQCDVFWNNEEFRTRQLAARGLFRQTNGWTRLGYRSRRLVINTNFITPARAPRTFSEATNEIWRGKVALAYPLFGTTATHFQALRQNWGDAAWRAWCRALVANKPFLVDGNSVAVKLVSRGEAWLGFTDSDDIADAQRDGAPIQTVPVSQETLIVHNTVGILQNCPHPQAAQRLYEFLSQKQVSQRLVELHALEGAALDASTSSHCLQVDWDKLLRDLDAATTETKEIFLR
jgi:iron(III) transport system substrate-binding protein